MKNPNSKYFIEYNHQFQVEFHLYLRLNYYFFIDTAVILLYQN
jgi:hypothetical protein